MAAKDPSKVCMADAKLIQFVSEELGPEFQLY